LPTPYWPTSNDTAAEPAREIGQWPSPIGRYLDARQAQFRYSASCASMYRCELLFFTVIMRLQLLSVRRPSSGPTRTKSVAGRGAPRSQLVEWQPRLGAYARVDSLNEIARGSMDRPTAVGGRGIRPETIAHTTTQLRTLSPQRRRPSLVWDQDAPAENSQRTVLVPPDTWRIVA